PDVEFLGQLLLHRPGQPTRDDHPRAAGPRRTHRGTIAGRDGCWARARATVAPSSAGLGATTSPAERMSSGFSAAVSPDAAVIPTPSACICDAASYPSVPERVTMPTDPRV